MQGAKSTRSFYKTKSQMPSFKLSVWHGELLRKDIFMIPRRGMVTNFGLF